MLRVVYVVAGKGARREKIDGPVAWRRWHGDVKLRGTERCNMPPVFDGLGLRAQDLASTTIWLRPGELQREDRRSKKMANNR